MNMNYKYQPFLCTIEQNGCYWTPILEKRLLKENEEKMEERIKKNSSNSRSLTSATFLVIY